MWSGFVAALVVSSAMAEATPAHLSMSLDREARRYLAEFKAEEAQPREGAEEATWSAIVQRLQDEPVDCEGRMGREPSSSEQPRQASGRWTWGAAGLLATAAVLALWQWHSVAALARATSFGKRDDHSALYRTQTHDADPWGEAPSRADSRVAPRRVGRPEALPVFEPTELRPTELRAESEASDEPVESEAGDEPLEPVEPTARRRIPRPSPEHDAPASNLSGDELRLFDRARHTAAHGDPTRALALLAEHEGRYPDSIFADERHITRAEALCRLGDRAAAREVAQAFIARRPHSHLVQRMRSICARAVQAPDANATKK